MIERRERSGLALEARQAIGIARECLGQHPQRDVTTELRVVRPIHLPHPAFAQLGRIS
jgi:hypothetical protein